MTNERSDQFQAHVTLKRLGEEELLVVVEADGRDDEPTYLSKLFTEDGPGFILDPLNDPHRVSIDDGGHYGGEAIHLGRSSAGFTARPPRALIDLLLPGDATEAVFKAQVESGSWDLHITLPQGGSLTSLFTRRGQADHVQPADRLITA